MSACGRQSHIANTAPAKRCVGKNLTIFLAGKDGHLKLCLNKKTDINSNKKLSYSTGNVRHTYTLSAEVSSTAAHLKGLQHMNRIIVDTTCYISRDMGIRKVSNSNSDLQGLSRSPVLFPFDRRHMSSYYSLPLQLCLYTLHHYRHIIRYFPKFRGYVTLNTFPSVIASRHELYPQYQSVHRI